MVPQTLEDPDRFGEDVPRFRRISPCEERFAETPRYGGDLPWERELPRDRQGRPEALDGGRVIAQKAVDVTSVPGRTDLPEPRAAREEQRGRSHLEGDELGELA